MGAGVVLAGIRASLAPPGNSGRVRMGDPAPAIDRPPAALVRPPALVEGGRSDSYTLDAVSGPCERHARSRGWAKVIRHSQAQSPKKRG